METNGSIKLRSSRSDPGSGAGCVMPALGIEVLRGGGIMLQGASYSMRGCAETSGRKISFCAWTWCRMSGLEREMGQCEMQAVLNVDIEGSG